MTENQTHNKSEKDVETIIKKEVNLLNKRLNTKKETTYEIIHHYDQKESSISPLDRGLLLQSILSVPSKKIPYQWQRYIEEASRKSSAHIDKGATSYYGPNQEENIKGKIRRTPLKDTKMLSLYKSGQYHVEYVNPSFYTYKQSKKMNTFEWVNGSFFLILLFILVIYLSGYQHYNAYHNAESSYDGNILLAMIILTVASGLGLIGTLAYANIKQTSLTKKYYELMHYSYHLRDILDRYKIETFSTPVKTTEKETVAPNPTPPVTTESVINMNPETSSKGNEDTAKILFQRPYVMPHPSSYNTPTQHRMRMPTTPYTPAPHSTRTTSYFGGSFGNGFKTEEPYYPNDERFMDYSQKNQTTQKPDLIDDPYRKKNHSSLLKKLFF